MGEAFGGKKYRLAHWNGVFLCFFNQWTGITVVILFLIGVFEKMKKEGTFSLDILVAVNICNLINMLASFGGILFLKCMSQKQILLTGLICLFGTLIGIIVCTATSASVGTVIFVVLFLVFFQLSIGPVAFSHVNETCHPSQIGLIQLSLFAQVLITSLVGVAVLNAYGSIPMFIMFACTTFVGILFIIFLIKDSTYKVVEEEEEVLN